MSSDRRAHVRKWLMDEALPFWHSKGVDTAGFGVWEELDLAGNPIVEMPKRLRVQARQAYVYSTAKIKLGYDGADFAARLLADTMEAGVDPLTGCITAAFNRAGTRRDTAHDLYDIAFLMLAASGVIRAGTPVDLSVLDAHLARLKAPRGWQNSIGNPLLPRQQNPHMHLFEAALSLVNAGQPRYLSIAEECLDLMREVFLQADGTIAEFFTEDWHPVETGQRIEPGHGAEWIYLVDLYERSTGSSTGIDLSKMFERVCEARDSRGFIPDAVVPLTSTRRLWPQSELLKAALVMEARGAGQDGMADEILDRLFSDYIRTAMPGGWHDKFDEKGARISASMPASTFYHILVALLTYIDTERLVVD